jgi:hypothetical protein
MAGGMRIGRETKVFRENLSQHHFVSYKSHVTSPVTDPRLLETIHLSYGTTVIKLKTILSSVYK